MEGFIITFFELLAAFAGFFHLSKKSKSRLRPFVYFLVITVFVEAVGSYRNFYGKIDFLDNLIGTKFEYNAWLYNAFLIFSLFFYLKFYLSIVSISMNKLILKSLIFISFLIVGLDLYVSGTDYFVYNLEYSFIWTTFVVFVCVALYFYEILISDKVLKFYNSSLFYISIGLLIWWLVLPPMIVYMPLYKNVNPGLVTLRTYIFLISNIILYSGFIIGFLWSKEE
ncbi:hypothetical protein [uncultured Winogradskyella sp.]|uniref:hypothetical protein n=1 Tax=uncultured Winogradskyella sp. TaxID=395353 RepID=UPI00262C22DE|nr:hypothetical protein [uncultured Winogradskyella sp.]